MLQAQVQIEKVFGFDGHFAEHGFDVTE